MQYESCTNFNAMFSYIAFCVLAYTVVFLLGSFECYIRTSLAARQNGLFLNKELKILT